MNFLIFNTLSGEKEPLPKPEGRKPLRLFVCGPTVYDYSHIGHARTYLVFDSFVKYLRSLGIRVFYLQNITDIDDKIIVRATWEDTSPQKIAEKYSSAHLRDMVDLGITAVDKYAPATRYIRQIIAHVKTLVRKRHAYKIPGEGFYFDVASFPDYGKLSHRTVLQAEDAVSRIDESVAKRNKGDFALWKFSKAGEPSWPADLGSGRPGWHIEDTAISEKHFGPSYDLHGGAEDLKFPHHEAEIAQAESLSGRKPFVKIWMHTGFLMVDGKKMAKSLRNFVTIREFLKKYPPEVLRLLVLSHHYRSPVNYTTTLVSDYAKSWEGTKEFFAKLRFIEKHSFITGGKRKFSREYASFEKNFLDALADDFNTPQALAALFEFTGAVQPKIWNLSRKEAHELFEKLCSSLESLGFSVAVLKIPREIKALAQRRGKFRINKQFVQADDLRKRINGLGYGVEDTPLGPFIWPQR